MSLETAYSAYQQGRYDIAETRLAAELMRNPGSDAALQLGAMVAARRGDLRTALARIQTALRSPANAHEKLNVQGNVLRALGSHPDAEASFESALEAVPDYAPALRNLAALQSQTDKTLEAADSYARLVEVEPDSDAAWLGRVIALVESQQLDAADAAISASPLEDADKSSLRARVAFYRDDYERAFAEAKSGIGSPQSGAGSFTLALQLLHMIGGWDSAGEFIENILAKHGDRADLWAAAMSARHAAGDTDAALALYESAPRDLNTKRIRAQMALESGDFETAETLAMGALAAQPGYPPLMHILCLAALGGGKPDLAQQVADMGLQADPLNQFYYAVKATAGRAKGQDYGYYFDYDRFVRVYDLDPPEGWSTMELFNHDLKAELDRLHGFREAPLDQTLRLGTQTAPDLRYVDSPAIKAFFCAVDPAIRDYLSVIGDDRRHAFTRRNIGGYRIRSAWSVRLGKGGHHIDHIHPQGWISSAYYVDVPEGEGREGWIKFGEPPAPLNSALGQGPEHEVQPKAGRLVLFPSYLWHGTYPITGDRTRMTLPIDILPHTPLQGVRTR